MQDHPNSNSTLKTDKGKKLTSLTDQKLRQHTTWSRLQISGTIAFNSGRICCVSHQFNALKEQDMFVLCKSWGRVCIIESKGLVLKGAVVVSYFCFASWKPSILTWCQCNYHLLTCAFYWLPSTCTDYLAPLWAIALVIQVTVIQTQLPLFRLRRQGTWDEAETFTTNVLIQVRLFHSQRHSLLVHRSTSSLTRQLSALSPPPLPKPKKEMASPSTLSASRNTKTMGWAVNRPCLAVISHRLQSGKSWRRKIVPSWS